MVSKRKMNMYTERYYELTEDEMQTIVKTAQTGDGAAQMQLLEIFGNFLAKYRALLYFGRYSMSDYDVRRFLALFTKDKQVRFFLLKNKLNEDGHRHVREVLRGIKYMIQRYGDIEDIEQTVNMTFLQCVERYEKKGDVPFSGYIYSYYFYLLKKNVDVFLIDQLGRKTFPLISDEESSEDWDEEGKTPGFTAPPEPAAEELLHAEYIDEYWVAGDTVMPPFDVLTLRQRQLLKWRYVNGERASEIANRITEHPNTVREHFKRIQAQLEQTIAEDIGEI